MHGRYYIGGVVETYLEWMVKHIEEANASNVSRSEYFQRLAYDLDMRNRTPKGPACLACKFWLGTITNGLFTCNKDFHFGCNLIILYSTCPLKQEYRENEQNGIETARSARG